MEGGAASEAGDDVLTSDDRTIDRTRLHWRAGVGRYPYRSENPLYTVTWIAPDCPDPIPNGDFARYDRENAFNRARYIIELACLGRADIARCRMLRHRGSSVSDACRADLAK